MIATAAVIFFCSVPTTGSFQLAKQKEKPTLAALG
jgi:hypothetical protein